MNMQHFVGFDGRIGRQSWWIGTIILLIAAIILYFILSAIMGTGMTAMMDPEKMLQPGFMESYMKSAAWQQLISLVVLGYPVTALMSKRLNDRDRPDWYKWLFWAPTVISTLLGIAGMGYTMADVGNGVMMPTPTTLMTIISVLAMAVGLWALIELGFLRGTQGQNQHGPDPVAG
jgi:uncharacterized membrane protein YhaH (DUF805 family)